MPLSKHESWNQKAKPREKKIITVGGKREKEHVMRKTKGEAMCMEVKILERNK